MNIHENLLMIQVGLKAPKNQYNSFGKYSYRSASDIMEAVKPWLAKTKCTLVLDDDLVAMNGSTYFKSTAVLTDTESGEKVAVTGFAREATDQKGMSEPQMSGACESYVHKYVLGQLFLIDDTKDPDTEEFQNQRKPREQKQKTKMLAPEDEDMVTLKDGRQIPRVYYEAMNMVWNGKKLGKIYAEDQELFTNLLTTGEPTYKAACKVIKQQKEAEA